MVFAPLYERATDILLVNPPRPVQVKLLELLISNAVVPAVECIRLMLPATVLPNAIERTLLLLELNAPTLNVTPSANVIVPVVKVYVLVAPKDPVLLNVTEPEVCVNIGIEPRVTELPKLIEPEFNIRLVLALNVPGPITLIVDPLTVNVVQLQSIIVIANAPAVIVDVVFPLYVNVPEANKIKINAVYVPPDDNVKPFIFNVVAGNVNDVVPKSIVPNQLPDVIVATPAPVVNVRFRALAANPAADPKVNVLATDMSFTVNPPGPVVVSEFVSAILNTVVAAVVCVRLMLPALALPNAIVLVELLDELNMPVVNVTPLASVSVPADSV